MSNIKHIKTISAEELLASFEEEDKHKTVTKDIGESFSHQELYEKKKDNKFYLPVLNINQADMWQSLPVSQRKYFTDEEATKTCLSNCCGVPGLKSACCRLDPDDLEHVLGPVDEDWIKRTIIWFKKKGMVVTRHDLVIDFEEGKLIGKTFFNSHKVFDSEGSYPMLRLRIDGQRFSCQWLNNETGKCGIYPIRSDMCRHYLCQYVKKNFLVKTRNHPNTYKRIDIDQRKD
jgi:Fe-S-cluster containining protein